MTTVHLQCDDRCCEKEMGTEQTKSISPDPLPGGPPPNVASGAGFLNAPSLSVPILITGIIITNLQNFKNQNSSSYHEQALSHCEQNLKGIKGNDQSLRHKENFFVYLLLLCFGFLCKHYSLWNFKPEYPYITLKRMFYNCTFDMI